MHLALPVRGNSAVVHGAEVGRPMRRPQLNPQPRERKVSCSPASRAARSAPTRSAEFPRSEDY